MGSADWFKAIISKKKKKFGQTKQLKGFDKPTGTKNKGRSQKHNGNIKVVNKSNCALPKLSANVAATKIQTVFRAYMARKTLRCMKGSIKFKKLTEHKSVEKQSASTLSHLHSWSRIQAEIRNRRLCMVIEGRLQQKKLDNKQKFEAKLHVLEVDWNSGTESLEEALARIHQREEASVKRERALAYAFNHQWRANPNQNHGPYDSGLGKSNWGWSWKERWISARPWERRVSIQSVRSNKSTGKIITTQKTVAVKSVVLNKKVSGKGRRVSYPGAEKPATKQSDTKLREATVKKQVWCLKRKPVTFSGEYRTTYPR